MGAGISVRNESDLPILVVCSQLSPLHWGRCDPGETWNAKNQQRMGKVWFSVSVSLYDKKNEPSALGTAARLAGITAGFVLLPMIIVPGVMAVAGITATRGTAKHGVYANCTCLVVRGVKFDDGKYQFYFAAQEQLDPKTGAVKSVTTFEAPKSVKQADTSAPVLYGMEVRLVHSASRARLKSIKAHWYPDRQHQPSRKLQVVGTVDPSSATESGVGDEWWLVESVHNADTHLAAKPVSGGDHIRLTHVASGRRLRSGDAMPGYLQPDEDMLVGCGETAQSNANDNWLVECDGEMLSRARFKLVHNTTGRALRSNKLMYPFAPGIQEVCCGRGRIENDHWEVVEIRFGSLGNHLDPSQLDGPGEINPNSGPGSA